MLDSELKSKINLLWNKFWSGGISNPLQAIEQMSYLIFMKRLEDEEVSRKQNANLLEKPFDSIFKGHEDYKWSVWAEYPAEQMLEHVRDKVFPFLRKINGGENSIYSKYMKDASFSIPTASLLVEAVKIINDMHIKEQNRDTKGDMYEYLLGQLQTAGKNGQFRTPRHIIKMMAEILEPKYGDRICDPACGTAGFLLTAYEYILMDNTSKELVKAGNLAGDKLNEHQWRMLREETLYGYDFDQTMVRISLMNLMMHGINNPNIEQKNTLSKRYDESNCYDVILANPPFKGSLDESEIGENFRTHTTKTELLFLELMYNLLTNSGKCAVIVPDGVLFGNSKAHKMIRELLLEKCRLDAIISMPSGVFKPYAGVSTAVMFFTKGEPTKEVWFYDMQSDGFSLDDKRTMTDKNDIPDIIERFKKRHKEDQSDRKGKCFFVPIKEIKEKDYDLSISKYKEIEYEEIEYEKPEVIKKKILDLENKIAESLKGLSL
ncbi:MAG: class I SAM-dependent DNA methyltransferase [Nanoarchaeota archaeon]|nr:type I restriction-modification system subunit M [Nanoarchaeota archaeon]MBU4299594.1 type I restriction-modification system subunit M [Nanoarchaeota archaeon]MBU4452099.1 type I restriction-modification system subunit M [Nanoarchaeota archaeon]